nr:hypothetical protein [Clostridia bacterium]
ESITTELCSGYQGLGGGAYQQAFCNSCRMALLATIIPYLIKNFDIIPRKMYHVIRTDRETPTK